MDIQAVHEGAEDALVHLFYVGLNIVQIVFTDGFRQLQPSVGRTPCQCHARRYAHCA